jgi:hypothetical protein
MVASDCEQYWFGAPSDPCHTVVPSDCSKKLLVVRWHYIGTGNLHTIELVWCATGAWFGVPSPFAFSYQNFDFSV